MDYLQIFGPNLADNSLISARRKPHPIQVICALRSYPLNYTSISDYVISNLRPWPELTATPLSDHDHVKYDPADSGFVSDSWC